MQYLNALSFDELKFTNSLNFCGLWFESITLAFIFQIYIKW